jgi:hypothetical protein
MENLELLYHFKYRNRKYLLKIKRAESTFFGGVVGSALGLKMNNFNTLNNIISYHLCQKK